MEDMDHCLLNLTTLAVGGGSDLHLLVHVLFQPVVFSSAQQVIVSGFYFLLALIRVSFSWRVIWFSVWCSAAPPLSKLITEFIAHDTTMRGYPLISHSDSNPRSAGQGSVARQGPSRFTAKVAKQKVRQSRATQPRCTDVSDWMTTSAVQPTFWDSDSS